MIRLLLFHASYELHLMFCTILILYHTYAFTIDLTEQEPEELQEQAPVVDYP
jgi:hypothetical protein